MELKNHRYRAPHSTTADPEKAAGSSRQQLYKITSKS